MADLTLEVARELAGSLVTMGHPYAAAAINGTALDLIRWCHGAIRDGRVITPEQQAEALVAEARTWDEGWPDKGGTAKLLALFRQQNPAPPLLPTTPEQHIANMLKRGMLAPPCMHCEPDAQYCPYGGSRPHAAELDWQAGDVMPAPSKPKRPAAPSAPAKLITAAEVAAQLELMQARAQSGYVEEQRRKFDQLESLGIN